MGRVGKAIELVQKVVSVARLRADRSARAGGIRAIVRAAAAEPVRGAAARTAVPVLRATTAVARRLAEAPFPPAADAERVLLTALAAQLRAAAATVLPSAEGRAEGSIEGALVEAIDATLALVDAALRGPAALDTEAPDAQRAELGAGASDDERPIGHADQAIAPGTTSSASTRITPS